MPATFESVSQKDYDFIVVGGGTAGAVVAARLTENPNISVLLVEAGNKETPMDHTIVPLLAPQASTHPEFTWQYGLVPQKALNDRPIPYPRGKAIGGTSLVNFLFALRGPSSDWDRIAKETGDSSWSWKSILPFAKKLETFVPPTGGWDYIADYDASNDGTSGPVRLSIANSPSPGSKLLVETAKKESLFNKNVNSGEVLGIGWLPGTIGGGIRNSSTNYLAEPKSNLDILTGALVTKVLFSEGAEPTAVGVEYTSGPGDQLFKAKAKKEVILSAGSIGSPHILMLSGVGDAKELKSHGIAVVKDLPEVGKNLQDHHLLFGNHFLVNSKDTFDTILQDQSAAQAAQQQFGTNFSGPLSNMVAQAVGFWRVPNDAPIWSEVQDSSSGPTAPHYEILFGDGYVHALPPPTSGNYFSAVSVNMTPHSRGSITLNSSDPFTFPNIDPNLLGTKHDIYIAVQAVKKAREYLSKPEFKDFVIEEYGPIAQLDSDEEIEAYVRAASISCWHPTSTASMSAEGSAKGVVNPDLTVKGVKNLRVVDASVLPYIPAAHPQLPVYIIAEKAAHVIALKYPA